MECQICKSEMRSVFYKEASVSCGDYFAGRRLFQNDTGRFHLHECPSCGFSSFVDFLDWSKEDFQNRIYNDDYHLCDKPFEEARPRTLSSWIAPLMGERTLLDFGGGKGKLSQILRQNGKNASSYDPYYGDPKWPSDRYDLVSAFEVVEHVPNQAFLFSTMSKLLACNGIIVFSTLLRPDYFLEDWWYGSPRNGHVCFHSDKSLKLLGRNTGLFIISLSREMHVAARSISDLAPTESWVAPEVQDAPRYRFVDGWQDMTQVQI